jgi:hypothetical protein
MSPALSGFRWPSLPMCRKWKLNLYRLSPRRHRVAPEIVEAARDLAGQIWFSGPVPRATIGPANDQCLANCVSMGWVEIRGGLIVRGTENPHSAERTLIPNF